MKKYKFIFIFVLLFAAILLFQYKVGYDFRIKPPSEEWSKEVPVSNVNGSIKSYPKMLKYEGENYIIAHQDGENIKVVIMDSLGKKVDDMTVPVGDTFIRHINLLTDNSFYYLNWITSQKGVKQMTTVKIDKNFKIVDKSQTKDVQSSIQIGSDVLVLVFLDRIELMDLKNNTAVTKKVAKAELVSGTYTDQGYLIAFHENKKDFKYFFVKDGITTDIKLAATMIPENKGGYFERVTAAADNKYAYIMVEVKTAFDRYGIVRNIAFSLDGKEQNINDFKFGAYRSISGPVNISSGDEARFVATTPRKFEKKGTQFDIIEFTLKDGAVQNYSIASRTNEPSLYPAAADNMLIFCNNTGEDQYEVLAASKDKAFKEVNNLPRKEESSRAISDVILDLINSFFLLFVFGLKWILFGLVAISIVSYLSHTMSIKYRKILYVLSYLVTVAVKVSTIYGLARMRNLPGPLQYPAVIIGVCLGLSALCLLFGYGKYRRDTEAIPAWSYSQAVFIDSLLTQMIFIPYIV